MRKTFFILIISASLMACKKDNMCYVCNDASGNSVGEYCGQSENDAYNQAKGSTINGRLIVTVDDFRSANCHKK